MDRVGMAALGFHLNGGMMNSKILRDAATYGLKQDAGDGRIVTVNMDVTGEHNQAGFHGPDMQIMDIPDAGHRFDRGGHMRGTDAGRRGLKQDLK